MIVKILTACFVFIFIATSNAYAYLDPASGGAIISAIIGAFVASAIFFKSIWYKIIKNIKKLFTRPGKKN